MLLSLGLFAADFMGFFGVGFPVVFVSECFMLTFGGIACLIKGGLLLGDSDVFMYRKQIQKHHTEHRPPKHYPA